MCCWTCCEKRTNGEKTRPSNKTPRDNKASMIALVRDELADLLFWIIDPLVQSHLLFASGGSGGASTLEANKREFFFNNTCAPYSTSVHCGSF